VPRIPKPVVLLSLVLAAALALAGPVSAACIKAKPGTQCWRVVIQEWYDGQISTGFPISCYQQAIAHLPSDVQAYSTAADDIRHAEAKALAARKRGAKPAECLPVGPASTTPGRHGQGGGISGLGSPSHADSVPLPLIVLAAVAGLLLVAGAAGFVARRVQARRVPIRPSESGAQQ